MTEVAEVSAQPEAPVSIVGEDGNFAENWMELSGVSEDLRTDQTLKSTKNIAGLASQLVNAQKMIGKSANMVVVPNEQSSQTEWDEFHKATGRPDTADEYAITHLEGVGDVDAAMEGVFKALVHAEGLRPSTVQKLIEMDDNRMMAMRQAMADAELAKYTDAEQKFKDKHGEAYEQDKHLANRMINDYSDENDRDELLGEIKNNPIVANFLSNIAKNFVEHKIINVDTDMPTPVEALAKAEELRLTPGYISGQLVKTSPVRYKQITEEIRELTKKAYPKK